MKLSSMAVLYLVSAISTSPLQGQSSDPWVVYPPAEGKDQGKHIVLVSGDEEYRSEEAMPMLGRVLSQHHGFRCTVLFAINPEDGTIDPDNQRNIPGLEAVADADLLVLFLRFRELPDEGMKYIVDHVEGGKPLIGIRTSTHAFKYGKDSTSKYKHWSFNSGEWKGGFGRQILGETWVNHHGHHGKESSRGVIAAGQENHPILKGVSDIWGPTDVYGVRDLPADAVTLVEGAVLDGMTPDSKPVVGKKNDPRMPLIWIRERQMENEQKQRILCSTIGSSTDMASEGLRRTMVNACYWTLGLEEKIPAKSNVQTIFDYQPTNFGFGSSRKGVKPRDHALPESQSE